MKKLSFYFLLIIFLVSCNSTKHVSDSEYLLTDNYIFIDSVKNNDSDLQKYILQKPNSRFLGAPLALYIHNIGDHNKPTTSIEWANKNPKKYNFIKSIFSEKQGIAYANSFIKLNKWFLNYQSPEILNSSKVKRTKNNLWAYYKTQGFFKSNVTSKIKRDSTTKKAIVEYHITKGQPTLLDTINIKIESPVLDSIYKKSGLNTLLIKGSQYKDQTFRSEAQNVVKLFRNNGIYQFSESALGFYVDSTKTNYKTNVDFIISGNKLEEENGSYIESPFKIFKIKEVNVITDYSFNKKGKSITDTLVYKGINFLSYGKQKYNPKYLEQSIFLKPNNIYKDTLKNLTRSHLKSLKNFKSTNISFDKIPGKDELKMDVFLSPLDKYTLGFDTEITHSNIRNIGASAKFSITDRNVFKGAELLKVSLLGSWFDSNSGPGWEIGGDLSIEIPRFIAPFKLGKFIPKEMSPRTLFSFGYSIQKNIGLDRKTFTILSDYKWHRNSKKTIHLEVFNTQYIQNLNIDAYFDVYSSEFSDLKEVAEIYDTVNNTTTTLDEADASTTVSFMKKISSNDTNFQTTNPDEYNTTVNILNRYNIITSDFLIPTIAYSFTYNNQSNFKDNNFSFFKIRVSNSGNVMGLLSNKKNTNDKKTFLNIPLAQYFKTDIEYKKFWNIGKSSAFGVRTFLGAIITYDNSDIPFTKSYFAGGSNDVRAWQTYELGPGKTNTGLEYNVGSLKFLTSAEYRFNMIGKLKGALFVDAGNIWDITGSNFINEDSKFTGLESLKDIAIGSGFGTRLDFSFLIVRFDIGFKTYEPYLEGSKWFKNYSFNDAVYNIGINYPF
ncbi:BamA/TamA family outer membrane protein [uncultured Polaribacter sp.]|uniref:translocation and assembly module lipoprotein TamL n=1 Tax=uncultured Polaribacter sp. TaxID=174711 RepID=UPI0026027840|nr:BamA/TamA family outer membrane protein [uncultured Polaribacter sp.]